MRTIPLPLPEPAIAPDGKAITGLAAFLETNGTLARHPALRARLTSGGAGFVDVDVDGPGERREVATIVLQS